MTAPFLVLVQGTREELSPGTEGILSCRTETSHHLLRAAWQFKWKPTTGKAGWKKDLGDLLETTKTDTSQNAWFQQVLTRSNEVLLSLQPESLQPFTQQAVFCLIHNRVPELPPLFLVLTAEPRVLVPARQLFYYGTPYSL